MNRQFLTGSANTIKDEIFLRQYAPWWQFMMAPTAVPTVSFALKKADGTAVASGAGTYASRLYTITASVAAGAESVPVTIPVTVPVTPWDIAVDDPIVISGSTAGAQGAEVRRVASIVPGTAPAYTIYLDTPLELPHTTADMVVRAYGSAVIPAGAPVNTGFLEGVLTWLWLPIGIHRERVDYVATPLKCPGNPQGFFSSRPAYAGDRLPAFLRRRGLQTIIDAIWDEIALDIKANGYTPSFVANLQDLCPAIYALTELRLSEQGYFAFPPPSPEDALDRLAKAADAMKARALGNIIYDSDDDNITDVDTDTHDISTIHFVM